MTKAGLYLMSAIYVIAGLVHLVKPAIYFKMMPPWVPMPHAAILVSGLFELLFGVGLLLPATRVWSAWGIILLLIAIFPANVYMWTSGKFPHIPEILLILRLPLQFVLIWWAYRYI